MNLDRLAVHARLRSNWESVDLGILLARRHWLQMAILWLLPAAAIFLLLALLFPDSPNWVATFLWWLKPMFERLPLLVLSRALFAEHISYRQALGLFRRANGRDWFSWLSWRRISFTRSFDMPVTVLENSTGKARTTRLALLHRKTASTASWLHIVGAHIEMILILGLAALFYLLIPEQLEIDWLPILSQQDPIYSWIANGSTLLIMAAVAPFYIGGGFMLYIGRRVDLEAWDIEIHFRKMRARLDSKKHAATDKSRAHDKPTVGATSALVCAVILGSAALMGTPQPALADPVTPTHAQELIDETLAEEAFHQTESVSGWRLKEFESREYRFPEWMIAFIEFLEGLGGDDEVEADTETDGAIGPLLAGIIEVLLWAIAATLVLYLLWQFRHTIRRGIGFRPRNKAGSTQQRPQTLFGLDVRSESLPDDVTAEVLKLWHSGAQREALGLLYRASLSHLISHFECDFQDHFTEAECAQLVREEAEQDARLQPALVQFFGLLTATWQQQAYAHRPPASTKLESLCDQWQSVFSPRNIPAAQNDGRATS
ncbi:hypothetical protein M0G74_11180 [Microbulbifer sp. CAU 1566]|uniref:DUF4129 domain-containing protein n=1 Tax=Microbulbifer sp. CAU 1566 TaxID=2933269 RepID=UPI00200419FB|nr:DUF4129 domain-containing protein [Microbulbifer sp. CAU 1566]MCK7597833.1 hypothetical protein [Microbulbifer sp. CAU 1566]